MMYQLMKLLKVPISPELHHTITSGTYPNIGHFQQVIPCPSLQLARCRPTYGRLGSKSGVASHQLPRHLELMNNEYRHCTAVVMVRHSED